MKLPLKITIVILLLVYIALVCFSIYSRGADTLNLSNKIEAVKQERYKMKIDSAYTAGYQDAVNELINNND